MVVIQPFFFYWGFLSRPFTNHRTVGEEGGHFFNFSLPLPPASKTLRHQLCDYCRELISRHRQQPDSNRESLVSERKSLTIVKTQSYKSQSCKSQRCNATLVKTQAIGNVQWQSLKLNWQKYFLLTTINFKLFFFNFYNKFI